MSKWYTIGENTSFNEGIEIVEMMINFKQGKTEQEVSPLVHWYISNMQRYFSESLHFNISKVNIQEYKPIFRQFIVTGPRPKEMLERLDYLSKRVEEAHLSLAENWSSMDRKVSFIIAVNRFFSLMSHSICGMEDDDIGNSQYLAVTHKHRHQDSFDRYAHSPLVVLAGEEKWIMCFPNSTGHFSFNAYVYGFVKNIILIGIPSGPAIWDNKAGCAVGYLDHEVEHLDDMMKTNAGNGTSIVYREIMLSMLSDEEKAFAVFGLWFLIHESNVQNILKLTVENNFTVDVYGNDTDYSLCIDSKLSRYIQEKVIGDKLPDEYLVAISSIASPSEKNNAALFYILSLIDRMKG